MELGAQSEVGLGSLASCTTDVREFGAAFFRSPARCFLNQPRQIYQDTSVGGLRAVAAFTVAFMAAGWSVMSRLRLYLNDALGPVHEAASIPI